GGRGQTRPVDLADLVEHSADPGAVRAALARLDGDVAERLGAPPRLAAAPVGVVAASRAATRLIETDAAALDVLADLDAPAPGGPAAGDPGERARWTRLAQLRT